MKIKIENCNYEIIKDYNNAFNLDDLVNRYTSYFEDYDYILGDYAYGCKYFILKKIAKNS